MTIILALSCLAAPLRDRASARIFNYEFLWEEIESKISTLTNIVSACEKLKCTPIPLSYSRHTSRFFSLFLLSLPFALVKETSPLLVVGIVAAVSWVLFSTDEIGHLIEEPFGTQSEKQVRLETQSHPQGVCKEIFASLKPDEDGYVLLAQLADLGPALENTPVPVSKMGEMIRLGEIARDSEVDTRLSFENFRLVWAFTATELRADRLETLPLSSLCDAINRDLFALWVAQRRAVGNGLVGEATELDDDALRRLNLTPSRSSELNTGVGAWSMQQVAEWMEREGFKRLIPTFQDNDIDGAALMSLTPEDLAQMRITSTNEQDNILRALAELYD